MASNSTNQKKNGTSKFALLTLDDKIKIIRDYKAGKKNKELAEQYNVTYGAITKIIKNADKYLQEAAKHNYWQGSLKSTRVTGVIDSPFEKAIYYWFVQKRHLGEPVIGSLLREKALQLHQQMYGETEFRASEGWLTGFKHRHGLRSLSVKGEILSVKDDDAEQFCIWFRDMLKEKGFNLDNVFNADETGLYWKTLPNKTLAARDEKNPPGRKEDKNRETVLTCANASGTIRVPLLLIGKSKNPRFFKQKKLPLEYENQSNVWMDRNVFLRWYKGVFLPAIKKAKPGPDEKFILLLDNAPSHPSYEELNAIDPQCEVVYLPPNVTSIIQPMDQGCISSLKRTYKTKFLRELLSQELVNKSGVQEFVKKWSLYDCCNLIANCWDSLSVSTLKHSWNRILVDSSSSEVAVIQASSDHTTYSHDVTDLANELSNDQRFSTAEIEEWIQDKNAELFQPLSDSEICQKFIEGETEAVNDKIEEYEHDDDEDDDDDDDDDDAVDFDPPLSRVFEAAKLLSSWSKSHPELHADVSNATDKVKQYVMDKMRKKHFH